MERRVRAERGPSARERCGNDWHSPPVFMGRVNQMPIFRDVTITCLLRYISENRHLVFMGRVNQMPIFRDVPEEASNRYGKLLTRLTGSRKARKLAIIQIGRASCR